MNAEHTYGQSSPPFAPDFFAAASVEFLPEPRFSSRPYSVPVGRETRHKQRLPTQGDAAYKKANLQVEIIASDGTKQLPTELPRDRLKGRPPMQKC